MKIQPNSYLSNLQIQEQFLTPSKTNKSDALSPNQISFGDILKEKTGDATELKFSKHASLRMENRNIELSKSQIERLELGTQKASIKGIHDSLVLLDEMAFIVNVPNKTVITAMDQNETNENVFTNIDGAVIA